MEKVKPQLSDCCKAAIDTDKHSNDHCSSCKKGIAYALVCHWRGESNAVCTLYDGKYYFFWQQTSDWNHVLQVKDEYVGQLKEVVTSLTSQEDKWGDMISEDRHRAFSNHWKLKVQNPEWAM